jgi:hypothetical protein
MLLHGLQLRRTHPLRKLRQIHSRQRLALHQDLPSLDRQEGTLVSLALAVTTLPNLDSDRLDSSKRLASLDSRLSRAALQLHLARELDRLCLHGLALQRKGALGSQDLEVSHSLNLRLTPRHSNRRRPKVAQQVIENATRLHQPHSPPRVCLVEASRLDLLSSPTVPQRTIYPSLQHSLTLPCLAAISHLDWAEAAPTHQPHPQKNRTMMLLRMSLLLQHHPRDSRSLSFPHPQNRVKHQEHRPQSTQVPRVMTHRFPRTSWQANHLNQRMMTCLPLLAVLVSRWRHQAHRSKHRRLTMKMVTKKAVAASPKKKMMMMMMMMRKLVKTLARWENHPHQMHREGHNPGTETGVFKIP